MTFFWLLNKNYLRLLFIRVLLGIGLLIILLLKLSLYRILHWLLHRHLLHWRLLLIVLGLLLIVLRLLLILRLHWGLNEF